MAIGALIGGGLALRGIGSLLGMDAANRREERLNDPLRRREGERQGFSDQRSAALQEAMGRLSGFEGERQGAIMQALQGLTGRTQDTSGALSRVQGAGQQFQQQTPTSGPAAGVMQRALATGAPALQGRQALQAQNITNTQRGMQTGDIMRALGLSQTGLGRRAGEMQQDLSMQQGRIGLADLLSSQQGQLALQKASQTGGRSDAFSQLLGGVGGTLFGAGMSKLGQASAKG